MAINPRKIKKKSIADLMPVVKQGDILSQRAAKVNRPKSSGTYSGYGNRTSSAAYGNVPAKTARQYDTQIGPQKPTSSGTYSGYGNGTSSADYGYKAKSAAPAGGTGPKKKKGATTSAAPAGGTGAKPKRKSHFQRRQAERYAIGSSGKSL